MESQHRDEPSAKRLSPRPSLHRRARAGRSLYGHGAIFLSRRAAAEEQSELLLLLRQFPETESLSARHRSFHRFHDGEKTRFAASDGLAISRGRRERFSGLDADRQSRQAKATDSAGARRLRQTKPG